MQVGRGGAGYEWECDNSQEKESEMMEVVHGEKQGIAGNMDGISILRHPFIEQK